MMSKKIQYTVEYPVRCSPAILYEFLSTSSGLQEWFAEKVEDTDGLFSFSWSGSAEELAGLLGVDIEEIVATMSVASRHVSMDSPLSDGEENTLMDVMANGNAESADQKVMFNDSLSQEIQRSLTVLTPRQKEVICYFYGIGMSESISLEDIGEKYCLTRERVRQIKDKALTKMRTTSRCNLLREYMGV
jgi:RNA polymerase primary sigma factor